MIKSGIKFEILQKFTEFCEFTECYHFRFAWWAFHLSQDLSPTFWKDSHFHAPNIQQKWRESIGNHWDHTRNYFGIGLFRRGTFRYAEAHHVQRRFVDRSEYPVSLWLSSADIRLAIRRQRQSLSKFRLDYVEPITGLFHFQMAEDLQRESWCVPD